MWTLVRAFIIALKLSSFFQSDEIAWKYIFSTFKYETGRCHGNRSSCEIWRFVETDHDRVNNLHTVHRYKVWVEMAYFMPCWAAYVVQSEISCTLSYLCSVKKFLQSNPMLLDNLKVGTQCLTQIMFPESFQNWFDSSFRKFLRFATSSLSSSSNSRKAQNFSDCDGICSEDAQVSLKSCSNLLTWWVVVFLMPGSLFLSRFSVHWIRSSSKNQQKTTNFLFRECENKFSWFQMEFLISQSETDERWESFHLLKVVEKRVWSQKHFSSCFLAGFFRESH